MSVHHWHVSQGSNELDIFAFPHSDHLEKPTGGSMESQQTFPASFGELLKTHRKRKRLTQKQLAQQLGVHANTISSWELGTYLPDTRGLVLELARHLALDEQEIRQLLEASLTALSPHWLVPLPRNPFFTGREEILEALYTQLHVEQVVALTQSYALRGLGGIGKTQIALEYAYRHALEYSAIFWIEAETVEYIVSSMLRIAELLQLPERQETDQQRIVAAVQSWLRTRKGQCHSNKKNIAKGRLFQMEGGMPALLPMEAGKSAFDDARAEAQATGRQQRLGITEISEQARMQAGQLAGLDDGELIAGGVQHMQSMAKTEAIRIEVGLQG